MKSNWIIIGSLKTHYICIIQAWHSLSCVAVCFFLAALHAPGLFAQNTLEISLGQTSSGYAVYHFEAAKEGSVSCSLKMPSGTNYFLRQAGNLWEVTEDFLTKFTDLTYSNLAALAVEDWTLTWDKGLLTETVATIRIGILQESDWDGHPLPQIVQPSDGAPAVSPNTDCQWAYEPGATVTNRQFAGFFSLDGTLRYPSEELSPGVTNWAAPQSLTRGTWFAWVVNSHDARELPNGLTITGDPWVLTNSDWLSIGSLAKTTFTVVPDGTITDFRVDTDTSDVTLEWKSQAGANYQIQFAAEIMDNATWLDIATNAGTGYFTSFTHTNGMEGKSKGFYRILTP